MSGYAGLWVGPGADGAPEFPVTEIVVTGLLAAFVATIVGGLASWKHVQVEGAIEHVFAVVGRFVGTHPAKVASATLLICFVFSGLMGMQESETDAGKLWVPEGSVSLDHSDYTAKTWVSNSAPTLLLVIPKEGDVGDNILTADTVKSMFEVHKKLMGITVDGDKIVKDSMSITDYTERYGGDWTFLGSNTSRSKCFNFFGTTCAMQSILGLFNYDPTEIGALTTGQLLSRIEAWEATPRMSMVPDVVPPLMKTFEVKDVVGGIETDTSGKITKAKILMWQLFSKVDRQQVMVNSGGRTRQRKTDPVASEWEADAVCHFGVQEKHPLDESRDCPIPDGDVRYVGLFGRSISDEFGKAIGSDARMIGIAYVLIVVYLFLNLGKRDVVHSMLSLSIACLICVGLSFSASGGVGALFGVKTNPLNNNIPFLLLGLGVDDAFVITSELLRHSSENPLADTAELISLTARTGGASVLITSVTDALAFLVGSSTKLPALSGFCVYAGIAVLICFLLQIFFFLPLCAANCARVGANRLDLFCCFKSKVEHKIEEPKGCCCCPPILPDGLVRKALTNVGKITVQTLPGKIGTVAVWLIIFVVGFVGACNMKKDFRLEWFFPDDSYVNEFIALNDEYFSSGTSFYVYTREVDLFAEQENMNQLTSYVLAHPDIQQSTVKNWWSDFRPTPVAASTDRAAFYNSLWDWFKTSEYKSYMLWTDPGCNAETVVTCDPTQGVKHTRIRASLRRMPGGGERFEVMNKMRLDITDMFNSDAVFPYASDFLYWEENGIIDQELIRNLIVAGGIVFMIICLMIPRPRTALVVSLGICMSIVELLGFMHWWGVTINGTSTIYALICLGLAVDYSAHIAHAFKESTGHRDDRALEAITRIGPSVFHALFSTILALVVLSVSKTYVFRVFFKVLFLVTMIAGWKGLWLLPVVLSLVGGDENNHVSSVAEKDAGNASGDSDANESSNVSSAAKKDVGNAAGDCDGAHVGA